MWRGVVVENYCWEGGQVLNQNKTKYVLNQNKTKYVAFMKHVARIKENAAMVLMQKTTPL